jgi:hypothetical protein
MFPWLKHLKKLTIGKILYLNIAQRRAKTMDKSVKGRVESVYGFSSGALRRK